jgi:hypothetical protein
MQMKLNMNDDWYPTEQKRMTYYVSRLSGKAYDQVIHGIDSEGTITFTNVDAIVKLLFSSFGDIDEKNTASDRLHNMRQGHQPLSDFLPDWISTASRTEFNDQAKISHLRRALHPDILHRISYLAELPTTLTDYLNQARKQDRTLQSLTPSYWKKAGLPVPTVPPMIHVPTSPAPVSMEPNDPMDLSAAQLEKTTFKVGNYDPATAKRKALTTQEKEARKAYAWHFDLCHYCLKKGHQLKTCPIRPPRLDELKANTATTSNDATDSGKA